VSEVEQMINDQEWKIKHSTNMYSYSLFAYVIVMVLVIFLLCLCYFKSKCCKPIRRCCNSSCLQAICFRPTIVTGIHSSLPSVHAKYETTSESVHLKEIESETEHDSETLITPRLTRSANRTR